MSMTTSVYNILAKPVGRGGGGEYRYGGGGEEVSIDM
jgi:hypothetical protein